MIDIKNEIRKKISDFLNKEYDLNNVEIELEKPNHFSNGNLSSNIAMKLAKDLKKSPIMIANELITNIDFGEDIIVEVAGSGFINFYYSDKFYNQLALYLYEKEDFTFNEKHDDVINVEYVSANPTGDLHLGHARNAIFGNCIVRLLRRLNYNVVSEYYVNDAGNQMNNLALSVKHFYFAECNKEFPLIEDGYFGEDMVNIAKSIYNEYSDSKLDAELEFFLEYAYAFNLKELQRILKELRVEFDVWTSERSLYEKDLVKNVLQTLDESNDLFEEEGALWLKTSKYLDDKDRVIKKVDGSFTYFAADIAYHYDKLNRGADLLIDIWGGDHHGYINRVKSSMQSLGCNADQLEILLIQMVSLIMDNKKCKMSKRAGTSVTIKDLLEMLDVDAIRYFFTMRSPDTQLEFNVDLAKEQSSQNPIYYIQYASARISSLLRKFSEIDLDLKLEISNLSNNEKEILDYISCYKEYIKEAGVKRQPHIICNYIYNLVSMYHSYYNSEPVFNSTKDEINDKIIVASIVKKVIDDGLDLIGIKAVDKM